MRMHVLQHVPFETPGMILDWAKAHEHEVTFTRFYEPSPALPCIDAYDFLVIMGGPMSVNEDTTHSWLIAEKTHIRQAIEAGKKLLGICLGAQVIAASLGAKV